MFVKSVSGGSGLNSFSSSSILVLFPENESTEDLLRVCCEDYRYCKRLLADLRCAGRNCSSENGKMRVRFLFVVWICALSVVSYCTIITAQGFSLPVYSDSFCLCGGVCSVSFVSLSDCCGNNSLSHHHLWWSLGNVGLEMLFVQILHEYGFYCCTRDTVTAESPADSLAIKFHSSVAILPVSLFLF